MPLIKLKYLYFCTNRYLYVNKDIYNKDVHNWVIVMISLIELEISDSNKDICLDLYAKT